MRWPFEGLARAAQFRIESGETQYSLRRGMTVSVNVFSVENLNMDAGKGYARARLPNGLMVTTNGTTL